MHALKIFKAILTIGAALSAVSCSVISRDVRSEALSKIPYGQLVENAAGYEGQTVILGGYILENESTAAETVLKVLQAPVDFVDEPLSKDLTQGRFIIQHEGYLDPEVFRKNRKITVAGTILPCEGGSNCHKPYLRIKSREIHLWPEYERGYYPYPGYFPYPGFIPYSYPYGYHPYGYPGGFRYHPFYRR